MGKSNTEIVLISKKGMSRQKWLDERTNGLGGSDISTILGYNTWMSAVELFHQKLGRHHSGDDNENMYWGRANEAAVMHTAQYYDFETGEFLENAESNNKLRKISEFHYIVKNPQTPWLLGNIDGLEGLKKSDNSFTADRVAEGKTISRQNSEKYERKFPPYYAVQQLTYQIILSPILKHLESHIYILRDGNHFWGDTIVWNQNEVDRILEESYKFWQLIQTGIEIIGNTSESYEKTEAALANIEPPPDDTEAYRKFYSQKFLEKESYVTVKGPKELKEIGLEYNILSATIKETETEKRYLGNLILKYMTDNTINVLDYGLEGRIIFNKRLFVNIK